MRSEEFVNAVKFIKIVKFLGKSEQNNDIVIVLKIRKQSALVLVLYNTTNWEGVR